MSASAELVCVHPSLVPAVWPLVEERLRAAYLRTDLGHTADLESDVLRGGALLWATVRPEPGKHRFEAAAVAKLVRTDRHLVCIVTACGGACEGTHWSALLEKIEAWARAEGAAKMRIYGRKGWTRVLKNYRVSNVVLERSL